MEIEKEILARMRFPFQHAPEELQFHKPIGCSFCGGTGYKGRVGMYEFMSSTRRSGV